MSEAAQWRGTRIDVGSGRSHGASVRVQVAGESRLRAARCLVGGGIKARRRKRKRTRTSCRAGRARNKERRTRAEQTPASSMRLLIYHTCVRPPTEPLRSIGGCYRHRLPRVLSLINRSATQLQDIAGCATNQLLEAPFPAPACPTARVAGASARFPPLWLMALPGLPPAAVSLSQLHPTCILRFCTCCCIARGHVLERPRCPFLLSANNIHL